jgi:bifunctional non-homologous end joining protein LigD
VIVQDDRGRSDFEALKSAIRWEPHRLVFYALDLLNLDREDLRECPLLKRRAKLKELVGNDPRSPVQFSEEFVGESTAFFRACAENGLEGMVSKFASSRYRSGRSKTWLKTKCFTESELTLLGIDRDRKTGAARARLAKAEATCLTCAGAAFIALQEDAREAFSAKLNELAAAAPSIPWLRNRDARWVKPELVVRVKHLAGARLLRHATVRAIGPD